MPSLTSKQARYWLGTIHSSHGTWTPPDRLHDGLVWLRGQQEMGELQGTVHWQLFAAFDKKVRLSTVKSIVGNGHWEPSRSEAAESYVFKEDTAIAGTRFELGAKKLNRNSTQYWDDVWEKSKNGRIDEIDSVTRIRNYRTITQIKKDYMKPQAMERKVFVLYGPTGTGKSHRAWEHAGWDAYPKTSTSIYWDGYQGQETVVMDEFRGKIAIEHLLTWFDKYPVTVQNKFGGCVLNAKKIIITSNLHPNDWFPDLDDTTKAALLRRLKVFEVLSQEQEIVFE